MELNILIPLLDRIHGVTFATLDTETYPNKSVRCIHEGQRVLLYRTKGGSGYEAKVKRHLAEAGKNPDLFTVGPLPWGERVDDLPLLFYRGEHYLQTIELAEGKRTYFIGNTMEEIPPAELSIFGVSPRYNSSQGLAPDKQVKVSTYRIDRILRIALMGEDVFDTAVSEKNERSILRIKT